MAQFSKNKVFLVMLAEIFYYYFANAYLALEQLAIVESRKPSMLLLQRIYNLKRAISVGIEQIEDSDNEGESTIASINYLKLYQKILDQMDDSTELTINFWSSLLQDKPTSNALNSLGRNLFKSKYNIAQTAEKILNVTSNHLEFFVKYGLFMKYVMHDNVTSDQTYKKILSLIYSSTSLSPKSYGFTNFGEDSNVMLLVASLNHTSLGTFSEINFEVEQTLGYNRGDLIGFSITNIMPSIIAEKHDEFVKKFFLSMSSNNLNTETFKFIKSKDGFYLPCKVLKKVVPRLSEGLQIALFIINDPELSYYTSSCKDYVNYYKVNIVRLF